MLKVVEQVWNQTQICLTPKPRLLTTLARQAVTNCLILPLALNYCFLLLCGLSFISLFPVVDGLCSYTIIAKNLCGWPRKTSPSDCNCLETFALFPKLSFMAGMHKYSSLVCLFIYFKNCSVLAMYHTEF